MEPTTRTAIPNRRDEARIVAPSIVWRNERGSELGAVSFLIVPHPSSGAAQPRASGETNCKKKRRKRNGPDQPGPGRSLQLHIRLLTSEVATSRISLAHRNWKRRVERIRGQFLPEVGVVQVAVRPQVDETLVTLEYQRVPLLIQNSRSAFGDAADRRNRGQPIVRPNRIDVRSRGSELTSLDLGLRSEKHDLLVANDANRSCLV